MNESTAQVIRMQPTGDTAKLMAKIREKQATGGRVIVGEVRRRVAAPTATEPKRQA